MSTTPIVRRSVNSSTTSPSTDPTSIATKPRVTRVSSTKRIIPAGSTSTNNESSTMDEPTPSSPQQETDNTTTDNGSPQTGAPVKKVVRRIIVKRKVENGDGSQAVSTPRGGSDGDQTVEDAPPQAEETQSTAPIPTTATGTAPKRKSITIRRNSQKQDSTPPIAADPAITNTTNTIPTSSPPTTTTVTSSVSQRIASLQQQPPQQNETTSTGEGSGIRIRRTTSKINPNLQSSTTPNNTPTHSSTKSMDVNSVSPVNDSIKNRLSTLLTEKTQSPKIPIGAVSIFGGSPGVVAKSKTEPSDCTRPLRPVEIAEWYGMDINTSQPLGDPTFDTSTLSELKDQMPNIAYMTYVYNPLFDEQIACEEVEIDMTSQEIHQYNVAVQSIKKKNSQINLLFLDPFSLEEEMQNVKDMPSSVSSHKATSSNIPSESVTSTDDVMSREDIKYPIQRCSKNWKHQLKKRRESKTNSTNSPSSPIQPQQPTFTPTVVANPLHDHLFYMPCWKHQLQLEQLLTSDIVSKKKVC